MWTDADRERVGNYGAGQALDNAQWELIKPFIPPEKPGGRHTIFPPWSTVYGYFRLLIEENVWDEIRHHLVMEIREQEGKEASPTAGIIDSQSAKTTEKGGRAVTTLTSMLMGGSAILLSIRLVCS